MGVFTCLNEFLTETKMSKVIGIFVYFHITHTYISTAWLLFSYYKTHDNE